MKLITFLIIAIIVSACRVNPIEVTSKENVNLHTLSAIDICLEITNERDQQLYETEGLNAEQVYENILNDKKKSLVDLVDRIKECKELDTSSTGIEQPNSCKKLSLDQEPFYSNRIEELNRCSSVESTIQTASDDIKESCDNVSSTIPDLFDNNCKLKTENFTISNKKLLLKACDLVASTLVKRSKVKTKTSALSKCSNVGVTDVCSRLKARESISEESLAELSIDNLDVFKDSVGQCIANHSIKYIEKSLTNMGKKAIEEYFGDAIKKYNDLIKVRKDDLIANAQMYLQLKACEEAAKVVADNIEQAPKLPPSDLCSSEALEVDQYQIAQCARTVGDACHIASGKISLQDTIGLKIESSDAKLILANVNKSVEGLCISAGKQTGRTVSIACATIAKSVEYIREAMMNGESNPWADCAGTPKIGRCVGQKWFEFSTGIKATDLQVGIEPEKKSNSGRTKNLCQCQRNCYKDYTWPQSNQFYAKENYLSNVASGDAGVRMCKAREIAHKNKGTKDGVSIMYTYNNCRVLEARQKGDDAFLPANGKIELKINNNWQTHNVPGYSYCK